VWLLLLKRLLQQLLLLLLLPSERWLPVSVTPRWPRLRCA
jgi:hypothetical protein